MPKNPYQKAVYEFLKGVAGRPATYHDPRQGGKARVKWHGLSEARRKRFEELAPALHLSALIGFHWASVTIPPKPSPGFIPDPDPRWKTTAVLDLAKACLEDVTKTIYLADALRDAGCDEPEFVNALMSGNLAPVFVILYR